MKYAPDLLVLTSPPASGKTYWIKTFAETLNKESLLIISPLRALADECLEQWDHKIKVMTPEEWISKKITADIVIFDEFHLHFYWGDTFRPLMWEVFYELSCSSKLVVLLTATLSVPMKDEIKAFESQFDDMTWCDFGNQVLKTKPLRYLKVPSKLWLTRMIAQGPQGEGVNLIFCQYREEVLELGKKLSREGFKVWTCVGGEAGFMRDRMKSGEIPDFIIATTVLSHGVNLPSITRVIFLYPLKNIDFWVQMVARGGRKGEAFEVYSLEKPYGIKWNRWTNALAILRLSLKMNWHEFWSKKEQWFLKESS